MKKQGQTESYSFLIGLLLMLLILGGLGVGVYKYTLILQQINECYDDLVNATTELEEGESMNLICGLKSTENIFRTKAILGFDKNEATIGESTVYFRPETCPIDKSCLCLCTYSGMLTYQDSVECNTECATFDLDQIRGINTQTEDYFNLDYYDDFILDKNGYWALYLVKSKTMFEVFPGTKEEYEQTQFELYLDEEYDILYSGESCLSAEEIDNFLLEHDSPLLGLGNSLIKFQEDYGIKAEVALSFFSYSTDYGKNALLSHNPGNIEFLEGCKTKYTVIDEVTGLEHYYCVYGEPSEEKLEYWEEGIEAWFITMNSYANEGDTTLETIIPLYFNTEDIPGTIIVDLKSVLSELGC